MASGKTTQFPAVLPRLVAMPSGIVAYQVLTFLVVLLVLVTMPSEVVEFRVLIFQIVS